MSSVDTTANEDFGSLEHDVRRRQSVVRYFRIFSSEEPNTLNNRTTIAGSRGRRCYPSAEMSVRGSCDLESLDELSLSSPEVFNEKVAFRYNFLLYFFAFLVGLHINLLNQIPNFYLTISVDSFKDFNIVDIVAGSVIIALISFLFIYHLYLHFRIGSLLNTLTGYTFVICVLMGLCFGVKDDYTFHFHHYFTTLLAMPLARFRTPMSTITQGFLIGFCLNGVIIYGPVANFSPVEHADASPTVYSSDVL